MWNFDKSVNRIGTNCEKWDSIVAEYKRTDFIPMWVADMDFEISPYIQEEIQKVLNHKIFGYQYFSDAYYDAIIDWMRQRHHFLIRKEWICHLPNVVAGLSFAVEAVSQPGDEIIIQTPVYGPFYQVVKDNGRRIAECPLKNKDGYYTMDFELLEQMITSDTKAILICNPHNPSGRVWTKEELQRLSEICLRHQIYIISDDIHSDLIMKNHEHTMIAGLSDEIGDMTITCTSVSKAFNLAGLQTAYAVIKNDRIREKVLAITKKIHIEEGNSFCEAAVVGAYQHSQAWLDGLIEYIEKNMDYFVGYIKEKIPQLSVSKPEGTYLVWVDCRSLNLSPRELREFFMKSCGIAVTEGSFFGKDGDGFVRFNLACPRHMVERAAWQIQEGIRSLWRAI